MRKFLGRLVLLALLLGPVVLAVAALERAPLVPHPTPATPEVARETRDFVHSVRALTEDPEADPRLRIGLERMNSVLAFGARLLPGMRGTAEMTPAGLRLAVAAPVPRVGGIWLNAEAVVPPFEDGLALDRLRVGHLELPPATTLGAARRLGDLVLGDGAASRLLASVPRMEADPGGVTLTMLMDAEQRTDITRRITRLLSGEAMPTAELMQDHYLAIREAIDAGELPARGSFLPYLRFVTERVHATAAPGRIDHEFTAALFALTRICGAVQFRLVLGKLADDVVPEDEPDWRRGCSKVEFAGRIDTRRHFVTAAAIKAATTMRISYAIGEYKELVDSVRGGGFDFTDVVANASGIRFADTLMATERDAWPALIARIRAEDDVLASMEGIPGLMPWTRFEDRFGAVDSPAYLEMVERIESRIDRLALHRGRPRPGG